LNQHPQVNADLQQCIRTQVTHQHHARRGIQTLHACIQRYAAGRSE
jgi:hypothetical protein